MLSIGLIFVWLISSLVNPIFASFADLSRLNSKQIEIWHQAKSQVILSNIQPAIQIVRSGETVNFPIFTNDDLSSPNDRYLFKQNIKKRVDWYLSENVLNYDVESYIYDKCQASLFQIRASQSIAGHYVSTDTRFANGFSIIFVDRTKSIRWFNGNEEFQFQPDTILNNGTILTLATQTIVFYNSNTDFPAYNQQIDKIIEQANIEIDNFESSRFFATENLICEQHSKIFRSTIRSLTWACRVDITFMCPLDKGSSCWLEEKKLPTFNLLMDSDAITSDEKVTVQINV